MSKKPARSIMPLMLVSVGVLLILVAAYSLLSSPRSPAASATPFVLASNPTLKPVQQSIQATSAPESQAQIPFPEIARVSLVDAKAALEAGSAVFLDVRGDSVYNQRHISGAVSIALADLEARLDELDPGAWIIPYCT